VVTPTDVRLPVREGREGNLVLLAVDASGSMAARRRLREVKTAVLSLLLDAYQRRDKVGVVTFRGRDAEVVLPPTSSVEAAAARLRDLRAGGRTPLAEGLLTSAEVLRVEALKDAGRRPLLVVVTDGRATAGSDALIRAMRAAALLRARGVASVVVDCEDRGVGRVGLGLAGRLADALGAEHLDLGEVAAATLTRAVRERRVPDRTARTARAAGAAGPATAAGPGTAARRAGAASWPAPGDEPKAATRATQLGVA
jgi:magnesium chelatase subunit D